jgi:hypothetical protein
MQKYELDDFSYHEVLHTAYLVDDFFQVNIADHIAVLANEELKEEAERIASELYKFYVLCSNLKDDKNRALFYEEKDND